MSKLRAVDVFGLTRKVPINYVERVNVDRQFRKALDLQRHIVIYGGSKQGKSSLLRHVLDKERYISFHCDNTMDRSGINANILKRAGFKIETSQKKSFSGRHKLLVSFDIGAVGGGVEFGVNHGQETTNTSLELDIDDVNDVVEALTKINFGKYIVLEDFHYLPFETQRDFSVSLKAFHEKTELIFIIVGVWLDENRLIYYNGDLTGRIISINADQWRPEELEEVIEIGSKHLNVSFSNRFIKDLIGKSFQSVYIAQEVCREVCLREYVEERQEKNRCIGENIDAGRIICEVANQQVTRYKKVLVTLTTRIDPSTMFFYQWLIHSIIASPIERLERGLPVAEIVSKIPEEKRVSNTIKVMKECLRALGDVQTEMDIRPIIFDYEKNAERVKVVDKGFLIWLNAQNRNSLIKEAGLQQLAQVIF